MKLSEAMAQVKESKSAHLVRPRRGEAGEYDCKPLFTGNHRSWTIVDIMTAGAFTSVYDALSDANKAKLNRLPMLKAINVVWSVIK